jgi:hypothetical protein
MRIILALVFGLFAKPIFSQPLKSPGQFLGYPLGEKFTPHYKIVDYFRQVSLAGTEKMKLEQYGVTNEGKELLLAFVSAPANIQRLEEIRKNNLRLTGLLNDKTGDPKAPAIVWLSFNVHGNEASSSEVSMKVLYELVSGNNKAAEEWLKNTIVIIDPCLNPDGRDRYVTWFNQVVGKNPVINPEAREHDEPWPGGRSNHYNFDLNRDWAWQTQVETQQRIRLYNEWMPGIHCDFHEQYINSPYYFAPAAEPFHEVISPWQRSFQATIGKNHAKYFDANGWLYFTKEYFDLFYPAYGDTYPIYNGSIGMTYEQAGHSMGGLAVAVNGDTLTLFDRIAHHFTTSMSTIETASLNAQKINEEFKKYFDEVNLNGSGPYKTYVLSGSNPAKLKPLMELLNRNRINFGYARPGTVIKGYNYITGKEENYTLAENDMLVSTVQPKGVLANVLMEPKSKLADTSTYDITAWSLPYAYGVPAYAVKEKLSMQQTAPIHAVPAVLQNEYAYLVEYRCFNDAKMLGALLQAGFKVRFSEKDFSYNGKKFNKGTLIILRNGNEALVGKLDRFVKQFDASVTNVSSGFMDSGVDFGSDKIHMVNKPRVAMLTGETASSASAGEVWHLFEQQLNYPIALINASAASNMNFKNIDVLIIPDGNYKILSEKESNLKAWVRQGGKIIAMENAVAQMAAAEWGIKLKKEDEEKPEDKKPSYSDIRKYEDRDRHNLIYNTPGAIYKAELDNSHPLAFGYPGYYFTLKLNSYLYDFMKDSWNVGVLKKEQQVAGFVGSTAREKIIDGTVLAVQPMGNGTIIYFADDPLFRSFWENGKLLIANAVFLVGQ